MSDRRNTIRTLIERVLWVQENGWLTTNEITERVNRLSPLNEAGCEANQRDVRIQLNSLLIGGRVARARLKQGCKGYSWRWKP